MIFRWVVPDLSFQPSKPDVLQRLLNSKTAKKNLLYYKLAVQTHPLSGKFHLDLLITFVKKVRLKYTQLDFLLDKHGDLTRYRNINVAILQYGDKQDIPLSNFPPTQNYLLIHKLQHDPFKALQIQMLKDPFNFDLGSYVSLHGLMKHIKSWSSVKIKIRDAQQYAANLALRSKPGIKYIDRSMIQTCLTPEQLLLYDSWGGYQTIVDYINQIHTYGWNRPFKALNPLLIGPPNVGKSTLVNTLALYYSVYPKGVSNWFPRYASHVYKLIFWDQFTLSSMRYPELLKFLQGSAMDLQFKGGSTLKSDNQLIIMTSNLHLTEHISSKFSYKPRLQQVSIANLAVRIHQICIPPGYNLFLLLKLIII